MVTGRLVQRLGDAEVHHHRVAAGQHDVLGLHVAMHDATRMGVGERVGDVADDMNGVRDRERARARERLAQGLVLDIRHHYSTASLTPPPRWRRHRNRSA